MAFRYQIKKGAEDYTFGGDGVKNLGNGSVESDQELTSPYLTLIQDEIKTQQSAVNPLPNPPLAAPVNSANPPLNEQSANKEENK